MSFESTIEVLAERTPTESRHVFLQPRQSDLSAMHPPFIAACWGPCLPRRSQMNVRAEGMRVGMTGRPAWDGCSDRGRNRRQAEHLSRKENRPVGETLRCTVHLHAEYEELQAPSESNRSLVWVLS